MANPLTSYFGITGDRTIDATTHGYRWALDSTRTVDFSVSNGFAGEYWVNPSAVAQKLGAVLNTISHFANIKFNFVGTFADPLKASIAGSEINLSLSTSAEIFPSSSIWAIGIPPDSSFDTGYYPGLAGDMYLNVNSQANYLPSYDPGSAGWTLLLHEIGHTLGLKHPHDDGGYGRPTFFQLGFNNLDLDVFSVMSYNDDADWNLITRDPATPMILDVLALQALYGKNQSTYAGDSNHYLTNTGNYSTIWDASGIDDINASGASEGWVITLPTAAWSTVVDTKVGAAVPISQFTSTAPTTFKWLAGDFENVVGSNYDDVITANQFDNNFFGYGGNDYIDGGSGFDTAYYSGPLSRYQGSIGIETVISDTLANGDGTDTLFNVERLRFSDVSLALDIAAGENAGSAYRLYKAALDRTPDSEGLGFWIKALDNGESLRSVANSFVGSSEFRNNFFGDGSNTAFVTALYNNVLGRVADQGGFNFWLNGLNSGADRATVLVNFSESSENQDNTAGLIANGIQYQEWVG